MQAKDPNIVELIYSMLMAAIAIRHAHVTLTISKANYANARHIQNGSTQ
jgi:hypothetical protein